MNEFNFRICKACGSKFTSENISQIICSRCAEQFEEERISLKQISKKIKECCVCGRPFEVIRRNQRSCIHPHFRQCEACGNAFIIDKSKPDNRNCSHTCARESAKIMSRKTTQQRYGVDNVMQLKSVQDKIKQTNLERYGVEIPLQSQEIQDKMKKTNLERYGVEWAQQSSDVRKKTEQTVSERYGVHNVFQSKEIKLQSKQTCVSKFGVENPMQCKEIQDKAKRTNLQRYGVEAPTQSEEIKDKSRKTNLQRYGVEWAIQSDDVRNRVNQTNHKKYGASYPFQSPEVQNRVKSTNLERYGFENPMQSTVIQDKLRQVIQSRYGVDNPAELDEVRCKISESHVLRRASQIQDDGTRERYLQFKKDPASYLKVYSAVDSTVKDIAESLGYKDSQEIWRMCHEHPELREMIFVPNSYLEHEILKYLRSLVDCEIIQHDRQQINPYELDIWIPSYKIGIEINDTYTHNSSIPNHWDGQTKPKDYHLMKTDLAEKSNIRLIHLFEYNWLNQKDIVKSMIQNALRKTEIKYYARNLQVHEVDFRTSEAFLNMNHIQGSMTSKVRLGLFDKDKLVSLMTFNKTRSTIGRLSSDSENSWELGRFCSLLNTSVIGGASKLFKKFIEIYSPEEIISFSNRSYTTGDLYRNLGFDEVHRSEPGYVWVHSWSNMWLNRVACQKQNLRRLFKDESIDLNKTESQIMMEHNFVQVYDAGNIRWEWSM